jgi:hypothetical protein
VIVFITIAVAQATSGLAVLDSAAQSTVCFLGQVLQVKGIHRALESDVQVRYVAFGERDDVHAGKRQSLEEAGGVFLVAAESVQRLGEDDVESPVEGIAHQRLESRAEERRARDGVVGVLVRDRPALPLCERTAYAELVGNGCVALIVRRVTRVDSDFHDFTSMDRRRRAAQLGLEDLACSLPREHPHQPAERVVSSGISRRRRVATWLRRNSSSSLALSASSFGHDTPANVERRSVVRGRSVAIDGRH